MPITPWPLGNTAPLWTIPLIPDTGYFDVTSLVVGNFSLRMHNTNANTVTTGVGTFSNIIPAVFTGSGPTLVVTSPAQVTYSPNAADVGTAGTFILWVDITLPSGRVQSLKIGNWQVVAE